VAAVKGKKLYSTMSKGLITEASALTYPDGATSDENNMTLQPAGNRSRRLGMDYNSTISFGSSLSSLSNQGVNEFKWVAPNNQADKTFLVLQIGLVLYFYTLDGVASGSLDLSTYVVDPSNLALATGQLLSFASGNGFLFVAGRYTEPLVVIYNGSSFSSQKLFVLIRDFIGLDDGLGPDVEPTTLSNPHKYNLQNQGWLVGYNAQDGASVTYWTAFGAQSTQLTSAASVIDTYHTDVGRYPPNSKLWWWAQKASFTLDGGALSNLPAGNILAPKGHYIVNAFYIDRSAVSAVTGLAVESTTERPNSVSYFAGRVWWGFKSTVYFTRVLDPNKYFNANFCCSEADPTSQKISDLVATDGGTILINDIGTIQRLYPVGSGMLVFGTNGISFIQGGSGGFSATDFAISKMSPIGIDAPGSIIEVDSQIFWMSYVGIQGMNQKNGIFGPIEGNFDKLNISVQTIQSFYTQNIPPAVRKNVKAVHDPSTNTIQWLYRKDATNFNQYDGLLCLDLTLQAFYPWEVAYSSTTPYFIGAFTDNVATLVTNGDETEPCQLTYITVVPNGLNYNLAFTKPQSLTFSDWKTYTGTGLSYESFVESGFEIMQDADHKKWMPYLFAYFRRTEKNLSTSDGGVTFTSDFPSSCFLRVKWGWTNSAVAGRWSPLTQVYRLNPIRFVDLTGDLSIDDGYSVVVTKNKIRGNGKAVQFRFGTSEIGKDFDLLGWATEYTGNTVA
jgi:hypothetical protein